ncbi:malto-oligosyltrehalose synthase [Kineococcus glutinatus]|uniref:Malto-oligosyltrehalose synthase n=1 Tax=Kineococcus glutinatus TaxID=1070872 RepID=A0ABP9I1F4_9ACTN
MSAPGGRRPGVPTGTYRFQVQRAFTFDDAAARVGYLDALGVSHAYLSPVLTATEGSTHGYDVVDHSRLSPDAGGREAFDRLSAALRERGLAAVADVVPNHMAVPTPASANRQLWSVMREGPHSPFAKWFDVDWSVPDRALLVPVLGGRIGQVLAAGELSLDTGGEEPLLRYYDHVFPVRPGTGHLPLPQLVDRQWYRLAHWRVADEELNYRRFFDVDTLAAIRVEDEEVFSASHALLLELLHGGQLDGLRIDHPDGLADPAGYLRRLRAATDRGDGGAWVVVEKILEGEETLGEDWACDGTTGYDALHVVAGLFLDPAGAAPLLAHYTTLTGDTADFEEVVDRAKREVVEHGLYAEVHRLVDLLVEICHADVDLRDHTRRGLHESVVELLVAMDRYRAYVVPGEPAPAESVEVLRAAAERARRHLPAERHDTLDVVVELALGRGIPDAAGDGAAAADKRAEFVVRFQQTCGPVMAKGVEDTAFYRWFRLSSLNEVGGDPARFGVAPEEFHAFGSRLARDWPATMTTLSTHDTKRSEDVRAQLSGLSERHEEWHAALARWREAAGAHREAELDARTEVLIWQTVVGTWGRGGPISPERLVAYLEKATREAKEHTTWTAQVEAYEHAVRRFAEGVLADADIMAQVGAFVAALAPSTRTAVLGQKLLQLLMPGVPDVYQGTELVDLSLVDPDNRRPVDYAERERRLAALDAGGTPADLDDEKLLVVSRALRLRRQHPGWFGRESTYGPVPTSTGNAVALARGDASGAHVVAVATRLPVALERNGGWGEHSIALPEGSWRCLLSGTRAHGTTGLAALLADLPVALLVRED